MKSYCVVAAFGLGLVGAIAPALAQPYYAPRYEYREREYEYRDRGRDRDYGYRDRDYDDRGRGRRDRTIAFDERAYLRCHHDVRREVHRGRMESGWEHYQRFGRREGRQLSC